ncbi:unnamed protein product [Calypogeia fissa]
MREPFVLLRKKDKGARESGAQDKEDKVALERESQGDMKTSEDSRFDAGSMTRVAIGKLECENDCLIA